MKPEFKFKSRLFFHKNQDQIIVEFNFENRTIFIKNSSSQRTIGRKFENIEQMMEYVMVLEKCFIDQKYKMIDDQKMLGDIIK